MPATQNASETVIHSISPEFVEQGWSGIVKIHGSGFDKCSFASFNAATPEVIDQSDKLIAVDIHPDLTANTGRIMVKVQTVESGASNEVAFVVKPQIR